MSRKQTKKSKYPSLYSPQSYVTAAQYVLELICEKKAEFDNTRLPIQFWNLPEWKQFFIKNLRQVHKLLKWYDEMSVINAVKSRKFKGRYSIYTPYFLDIVKNEEKNIQMYKQKISKNINETKNIKRHDTKSKPRTAFVKPNIIDKLDNDE